MPLSLQSPRSRPSGRFLLRIAPALHDLLRRAAAEAGLSLNDYCSFKLAAPLGSLTGLRSAAEVVRYAADLFGQELIGIAVFGSWARGDPAADSDVDLLVVLEENIRLNRELYRRWDRMPQRWDGRRIEPLFVQLPSDEKVSGIWAEVATDGIILFEQSLRLSRRLARVRRAILRGQIERKLVRGQAYWVEHTEG